MNVLFALLVVVLALILYDQGGQRAADAVFKKLVLDVLGSVQDEQKVVQGQLKSVQDEQTVAQGQLVDLTNDVRDGFRGHYQFDSDSVKFLEPISVPISSFFSLLS